jgi:DNA replication licensing factor MCM2
MSSSERNGRAVIDDDEESVGGSRAGLPTGGGPSQQPEQENDDVMAELFGDERDEAEDDDEEGENLFGDDMANDYQEQPELDVLSESGLDDRSDFTEMSPNARRAAEREMAARDDMALGDEHLFYEHGDEDEVDVRRRKRLRGRGAMSVEDVNDDAMDDDDMPIDILENMRERTSRDHVSDEAVGKEIVRRFRKFLRTFKDPNKKDNKYIAAIKQMVAENKESLEVDYDDLANESGEQNIAYFLPEAPIEVLARLDQALTEVVNAMYPYYSRVTAEAKVRIKGLPVLEEIRLLRQIHLNMLIKTQGVVTVTTGILPQLAVVKFDCVACSFVLGPFVQRQDEEVKPSACPSCQSRGPFELNAEETIYHNYQRITVQESPNLIAAGRLPRSKEVILVGDLCDTCKPGDEIELTGIYTNSYDGSMNSKQGFPVFNTIILANHIIKTDQLESDALTDEDIKAIRELSKDSQLAERVFASIAPTIYGHNDIKQAIALSLFRGESKNPDGKHQLRGDINVLLCGDPGTAKSQFLRYVAHLAPRAVLTTGQGASAVGLTAYVQRHPVTREWTLEAGAMVLADKGVCLIDEFDKMNDQDRTSIHEAMEQQSISISKAGIVTSLHARCTVIAAANPIGGRYDSSRTFAENVELTEPILSRFDILCVVRDTVDPVEDELLADFVTKNHMNLHPDKTPTDGGQTPHNTQNEEQSQQDRSTGVTIIPQTLLRKYIIYARDNIHPKIEKEDERIIKLYGTMRKEAEATGSVAITIRSIESMIRMAEAHAKMHLRNHVNDDDLNAATRIMLECFINTQKAAVVRQMRKTFHHQLTYKKDHNELLLFLLKQLVRDQLIFERSRHGGVSNVSTIAVPESDFLDKARQMRIEKVKQFYKTKFFLDNHFQYDAQRSLIVQTIY